MGYTNFLIWAGKQGFKYGQKYLYKAWKEAEKLGKPIAEKHFPKLINKAEDLYKNFKGFDPKVVPKEIVKPKRFKWDDAGPGSAFDKRLRAILDKHKAKIKPENLNAANTSRFVTGAKEGITSIKPPGFNPSVIKGGKKGWKPKKAEGGRIGLDEGGPSQKEIDKGIAAIEKLKSSLMPESYEELIEIYKDKQKDLNIDIMESAGGLGEMLGEGGVAGHSPLALEQLPSQRRKKHIPHKFPKLGEGGRIGMMYGGDPGFAFSYGGSWADWKENHASEMPVMDYINQKLPKARNPFSNGGEVPLSWEEIFTKHMQGQPLTDEERKILGQVPTEDKAEGGRIGFADGDEVFDPLEGAFDDILEEIKKQRRKRKAEELKDIKNWDPQNPTYHASGGRIGMAKGDTPSEAYLRDLFYDGGWDAKGDIGLHEFMHGPIGANEWFKHNNKAKGGRIGFQEGTGIMSQTGIPYYADKALEGIVNSAETLSKLPFAAGKLGSQLLQSPPDKKMFSEAVENITPGSWSKNLGISSLAEAEGAKVSPKQKTIGNVLGLGTEIAVPVGGAFKIGQKIIDQASKVFGKLKKGKTLDQTINDKITDFGQSRRDFNATVAASGLMVALKGIGLGGLLKGASKKVDDIRVTYKTGVNEPYELDDVATWMGNYEFESLTAKGINILKKVFGKDVRTVKDPSGKLTAYVDNVDLGEATSWVDDVKKAGGKMELEHVDDYGNTGRVWQSTRKDGTKLTAKQEFLNDAAIDSGYGLYDDSIGEVYDIIYDTSKVKKSEGGSVGYPPVQWNPKEQPSVQGPSYETNNPNEAFKEILRRNIGSGITAAPLGGKFSLDVPYGQYGEGSEIDFGVGFNTDPRSSGFGAGYGVNLDGNDTMGAEYRSPDDSFNIGVRKQEGSNPQWNFQKKWKFAKGGKAWQPKSAPQLTTTIPPESGPMPHGLTYLTGDDIVQNIGYKHGRN